MKINDVKGINNHSNRGLFLLYEAVA